jgi:hypothetical protein
VKTLSGFKGFRSFPDISEVLAACIIRAMSEKIGSKGFESPKEANET